MSETNTRVSQEALNATQWHSLISQAKSFGQRPTRTAAQHVIVGAYLLLGLGVFVYGCYLLSQFGAIFSSPLDISMSIGSVPPPTHSQVPDEYEKALEAIGYAAVSLGVGIIGIGISLLLQSNDKDLDKLLATAIIAVVESREASMQPHTLLFPSSQSAAADTSESLGLGSGNTGDCECVMCKSCQNSLAQGEEPIVDHTLAT